MKKVLIMLFLVIFVFASVTYVTMAVSQKPLPQKAETKDSYPETVSSETYEIVEFVPPQKTVYSLSEVYIVNVAGEDGNLNFVSQLNFDGTGMSMTVKNKETGTIKKYDYTCEYFDLDGDKIKCESNLSFYFNPPLNTVLTEGEHSTEILLTTDDGECISYDMKFSLVDDADILENQMDTNNGALTIKASNYLVQRK